MDDQRRVAHVVVPPDMAREVVSRFERAYLRNCVCREKQKECPTEMWEVCLLFDAAPGEDLKDTKEISSQDALAILTTTAERSSVYRLFFWEDDHRITELCSCCNCCCSPHRSLMEKENFGDQVRSGFLAETDGELCMACGDCIESCPFEARAMKSDSVVLDDERCFGCGRCIDSCPEGAIQLEKFEGLGMDLGMFG